MHYDIPDDFRAGKAFIHVTHENVKELPQILKSSGFDVYYDFVDFCTRWLDKKCFVICFLDIAERVVHINGNYHNQNDDKIYELKDLAVSAGIPDFIDLI